MKTKLTLLFIIVCLINNTIKAQIEYPLLSNKFAVLLNPNEEQAIDAIIYNKSYLLELENLELKNYIVEIMIEPELMFPDSKKIYLGKRYRITGVIIDGKKESLWKVERSRKTIREETYYNGLLHGVRRSFSPKDSLSSPLHQTIFTHGTGFYVDYYPNDRIQIMGQITDGERDDEWQEFYPSGKLKSKMYYSKGLLKGEKITYFENGEIKEIENYSKGLLASKKTTYFENGEIKEIENYSKGLLAGKKTTYFENGKVRIEANYKDGLLDGKYTIYSTEGEVLYTTQFKQGVGLYKSYDTKTNELLEEGSLEQGYRVGKWVLWTYYNDHYTDERKRYSTFKNYNLEEEKNKKLFYSVVGETDVYNIMVDVVNE